ncbi:pullulanase [Ruoffia tabacinasalis]|uniref:pullulanase n=1 Tax=Ruoffia tabacinasalis TaxID=87458 RepID=A0A5R9DUH1_9LACT|nr:pullulanase [Ruoffia tabacinasalis]TLQ40020.1 pullulanase [Ruoffia tabacinasalis]
MVSHRNKKLLMEKSGQKVHKFGLKKLKVGVVSVAMTAGILVSHNTLLQVNAEELVVESTVELVSDEAVEELPQVEAPVEDLTEAPVEEGIVEEEPSEESPIEESTEEIAESEESVEETLTEESETVSTLSVATLPEIAEGDFRLHFDELPEGDPSSMGLWMWGDVETPSDQLGGWPNGATNLSEFLESEYGYYLDVAVKDNAQIINYLINTVTGNNVTEDQAVQIAHSDMNQVWINEEYEQHLYEPLENDSLIRINYEREDGDYEGWGLWIWGEVDEASEDLASWPDGAFDFVNEGPFGRYVDVHLSNGLDSSIQFLLVNKLTGEQSGDMTFSDRAEDSQVFLRDLDPTVHTSPYAAGEERLTDAEMVAKDQIIVSLSSVSAIMDGNPSELFTLTDSDGNVIPLENIEIDEETNQVIISGDFSGTSGQYTVSYGENSTTVRSSWRLMDDLYAYDGDLGSQLYEDGTVEMNLWAPTAEAIRVVLYDKNNQDEVLGTYDMARNDTGVWNLLLDEDATGLGSHQGYYYHYEITRDGESVLALDPYAKSLAAWNNLEPGAHVAKAAIVDPSTIGPELDYANIPGYTKREDAIIYEVHVRDFTSDPSISEELTSQFGTFSSFVERLDYLQDLGVTHIQLLPVMSYFYANEFENGKRELDWSASENNYNWGYDPQSYFALTGMYSENPQDPEQRIAEFKNLVNEIHKRDMGVILDVVFNHTARTSLFEDLEPNYYHFMDKDGTPRESFGGGRLGTTHHMSRRVLVDSIKYWVDEFKVDGFRFDMMGDHDAEAVQMAYDKAAKLNPNILMLGEGWITFTGDEDDSRQPADQSWMNQTDGVAVFSDEIRNMLKSGFGSEGQPKFLTRGAQVLEDMFNNIIGLPSNVNADDSGDIIQYIAAHDNLTLHDVIAQSIKKDPAKYAQEIHQRIRLGNLMILTSQGTAFIHAGQEFGRTKQFRHEDYITTVDEAPYKTTYLVDEDGNPFEYPYFVHDSYDATDMINKLNWNMALNEEMYPIHTQTQAYTKGLIHLRRAVDGFRWGTQEEVEENIRFINAPEMSGADLVVAYEVTDSQGNRYAVFINSDESDREFTFPEGFEVIGTGEVIVDGLTAGTEAILNPEGVVLNDGSITLSPLTATIIRYAADGGPVEGGGDGETPEVPGENEIPETPGNPENPEPPETPTEPDEDPSESDENEIPEDETQQPGGSDDTEEETEGGVDEERSIDLENTDVDQSSVGLLPATGEDKQYAIFSATALAVLSGVGLIASTRKKEEVE